MHHDHNRLAGVIEPDKTALAALNDNDHDAGSQAQTTALIDICPQTVGEYVHGRITHGLASQNLNEHQAQSRCSFDAVVA